MVENVSPCIIDTNVPIIANKYLQVDALSKDDARCVLACVEIIMQVMEGKLLLVVDEGGEIFQEYCNKLSLSGKDGLGDAFVKWVHDNQWTLCKRVAITKLDQGDYQEFPNVQKLKRFDPSDKKFVAVAIAYDPSKKPIIFVAIDRGWYNHKEALKEIGIKVKFLCPEQIQQSSERSQ